MNRSRLKILIVQFKRIAFPATVRRVRMAGLLFSFTLAIGISAIHHELSAQETSWSRPTDAAGQVDLTSQSDLYFQENSPFMANKPASPQRDPRSITPPTIPAAMLEVPGTSQPAARMTAGQNSRSFDGQPVYRTALLPITQDTSAPKFVESANNFNAPSSAGSFIPRDEPELELPSNLQMADQTSSRQMEVQSREMFWDQFSKMPADKDLRTEGYDSLPAILNNGFWFGGVDLMFIEPIFQGNNVLTTTDGATSNSVPADFNFDAAWKGNFGFETNAGPAVKASFFRYNEFSGPVNFVSDGTTTGESIVQSGDPANVFRLAATSAGDRIDARQQIKLNSVDLLFYKDQKNLVSRVRGNVGLRFLSLQQFLFADLFEAAGPVTSLRSVNDLQAMGPKLGIEYFRPIGHTDLELQTGLFGSLMFGRRDHTVTDVGNLQFRQLGKIEPLSIFEMYLGLQWNFQVARCQTAFVRTAIESQYWSGSESPGETDTDFGFYGLTAGFGIKR